MTEAQLVAGCRLNMAVCHDRLYHKYSHKMLGVCYRYAKNVADAEDMLQEGFIRVFSQIQQYRGQGALEAWIRKIMVNTCINILKRNKKFADCLELSVALDVSDQTERIHSIMHVKEIVECIRMLPLGYRTVLNLYAIEGYSHREIADLLDIEEVSSRSQYARAKTLLEKILTSKKLIYAGQFKTANKHAAS